MNKNAFKLRKPIRVMLALTASLQLFACAATEPAPDNNPQPQASSAPIDGKLPSPDNADELYAYAVKLEEQGKDADALSYYLQATQVNPEHLKAQIALAQLYTKFGRKTEAKVTYENILRLDSTHPFVAQYKEARLKFYSADNISKNEEYDKALQLLAEAPRGTPMDDDIANKEKEWKALISTSASAGKSQEIIEQASLLAYQGKYQQAIDLIKTAPDANSNATVSDKLAQWQKALQNAPIQDVAVSPPPLSSNRKMQTVSSDDVNLRQSPYLYAESLGTLKQGTSVEILLDKGYEADGYQWSKVKAPDGKVGWVAANLLSGGGSVAIRPSSVPTPRPVPTARPVPITRPTAAPTIVETTPAKTYGTRYIKGDTVNIRRSPALSGSLLTQATDGSLVVLLSERSIQADGHSWSKVKLSDGQIGWIANDFLRNAQSAPPLTQASPKPPATKPATSKPAAPRTAQINASDVNVRSAPSAGASVVTTVSSPAKVTLLADKPVHAGNYVWQHVQLPGGQKGWVVTQFLGSAKPAGSKPAANVTQTATSTRRYIRGDSVNIRKDATTGSAVLTQATEGTAVTLLSTTPVKKGGYSWYKIRLSDGRIGWVVADFLGK